MCFHPARPTSPIYAVLGGRQWLVSVLFFTRPKFMITAVSEVEVHEVCQLNKICDFIGCGSVSRSSGLLELGIFLLPHILPVSKPLEFSAFIQCCGVATKIEVSSCQVDGLTNWSEHLVRGFCLVTETSKCGENILWRLHIHLFMVIIGLVQVLRIPLDRTNCSWLGYAYKSGVRCTYTNSDQENGTTVFGQKRCHFCCVSDGWITSWKHTSDFVRQLTLSSRKFIEKFSLRQLVIDLDFTKKMMAPHYLGMNKLNHNDMCYLGSKLPLLAL